MSAPTEADSLPARLEHALAAEVAPVLQMDAGDIELLEIRGRVARLRLRGTCACCPSSVMAVIMGIEQELRRQVPEIDYIELVP